MKRIFLLFMLSALSLNAQESSTNLVSIPKEMLTEQQQKLLESESEKQKNEAVIEKIETYSKFAGVGKEIGIAVREGLTAVVDVSEKFGKTDVGKFTMILIAWNIVGKDITKIFIGILFLIIFNFFVFKIYRSTFISHRIRKTGHWWKFWESSEFQIVDSQDFEGDSVIKFIAIPALVALSFVITFNLMF